jgi:hypothetical protein
MITESMLQDQIDLTEKLGLTGEEAAIFAEYSLLTGESQESIVNSIGKQNKGILSNKKVIQEVAKIGGQLAAQYKNNPRLIAQAVAQAQKLGMTMQQTQNVSKNLLNFEESIAAELEAELLTGMDLNLEKARYLALQGKSVEAAAELMKNLGPNGLNKFQNMNVLQQEALAKSLGMSADELADSLRTQKAISSLSFKDRAAYKEAIKLAEKNGDFEKAAALEQQMNQGKKFELAKLNLSAQEKFNKAVERLKGLLASIVEGPLGRMADKIMKIVEGILKIPMLKEALKYAAPLAAILTGTLFVRSLVKGIFPNTAMWVRSVGGGIGGLDGGGGIDIGTPTFDPKTGRYRDPKTGRFTKPPKVPPTKGLGGLGKFGKFAKGAGWLSVLGAGIDLASNMGDEDLSAGDAALKTLDQNKFTAIGAGIGALFGGVGAIPGAAIGGIVDLIANYAAPNEGLIGDYSKKTEPIPTTSPEAAASSQHLERIERHLSKIASKEGNVYLGATKVGTAVTMGTYKTQ